MRVGDLNEVWAKENEGKLFSLYFGRDKYSDNWTVNQLLLLKSMRGYENCTVKWMDSI